MSDAPLRTDQQLEAVRDPERDVFLRAGAGTGKTTVLVDRFCTAALDPEVGVERILAFTFTERAADQLRRRVRAELAQMASEASEPELLERLREAEQKTERAWISTIHGFCRRRARVAPRGGGDRPPFSRPRRGGGRPPRGARLRCGPGRAGRGRRPRGARARGLELAPDADRDDPHGLRRAAKPGQRQTRASRSADGRPGRANRRARSGGRGRCRRLWRVDDLIGPRQPRADRPRRRIGPGSRPLDGADGGARLDEA